MRITTVLCRQHIGFMFKNHWRVQGKRNVEETPAIASLLAHGITPKDPNEYLKECKKSERVLEKVKIEQLFEKPLPLDETHPEYKQEGVYIFGDSNVLVQGVKQAQVLLKTAVFNEFPQKVEEAFESLKLPADVERSMQQAVLVSHLLDAEQQKTIKIVNPLRPMRPYPRNYGITEARKNLLLSTRLLAHCERFQGHIKAADRKIINNAFLVAPFKKDAASIQAEVTAETFMTSRKPISSFNINANAQELPDIFPLAPTVSIPKEHFYEKRNVFPINSKNTFSNPHTIMLHYSSLDVKNLYEAPVTPDQFEGRAMMKAFATAASRAQSLYGPNVRELETPIVVQVVQLETNRIQFGIFQLNTLDLDSNDGVKNLWFSNPAVNLYDECCYNSGRPALKGYNFDVFRLMNVFYSN